MMGGRRGGNDEKIELRVTTSARRRCVHCREMTQGGSIGNGRSLPIKVEIQKPSSAMRPVRNLTRTNNGRSLVGAFSRCEAEFGAVAFGRDLVPRGCFAFFLDVVVDGREAHKQPEDDVINRFAHVSTDHNTGKF